jgi:regulator of PEP synthase PpsR (kinase-PPPase family)
MTPRHCFFVSDGTGITAEAFGQALLTQFPGEKLVHHTLPFISTTERAEDAAQIIRRVMTTSELQPLVFSTLIHEPVREVIVQTGARVFDLFSAFVSPLEEALGQSSSMTMEGWHGNPGDWIYAHRIEAIEYAVAHDDGVRPKDLDRADVVLVGVSRSGKTPTCLYLSMQYGIHAANYPLTEDDLEGEGLPSVLEGCRDKLVGLIIAPERLSQIRQERRPNSRYASLAQCRIETARTETLFKAMGIPYLDTTAVSIEEIATTIIQFRGLRRAF